MTISLEGGTVFKVEMLSYACSSDSRYDTYRFPPISIIAMENKGYHHQLFQSLILFYSAHNNLVIGESSRPALKLA